MSTLKFKLSSRKFWLAIAAFLGSIGTSIYGMNTNNEIVQIVGIICAVVSTAVYSACEAYVDGENSTHTNVNIPSESVEEER